MGISLAIHLSSPADDVVALADVLPIPGLGFLPVNAYLGQAEQPLLVDSGLPGSRTDFIQALWSQIEPDDLRWIYLTHPDRDHTGSLMDRCTVHTLATSPGRNGAVAGHPRSCSRRRPVRGARPSGTGEAARRAGASAALASGRSV
jgi:glyoxylase-like metal-dependent hydrolase (beta-lactamase superfamily II)